MDIIAESRYRFVIPRHGRMLVPGVVFASRALLPDPAGDLALEQVVNVAELPGIMVASYAMPDVHWGYGFPIDGAAATDVTRGGVVSPGGVGFDIACGVRLLAAGLSRDALLPVMDQLAAVIPRGGGRGGLWDLHGRAEMGQRIGPATGLQAGKHRPGPGDKRPCPAPAQAGMLAGMNMSADSPPADHGTTELMDHVRRLEGQVTALTEAVEVLTRGLESNPMAGPPNHRIEEAARRAHELLLLAKSAAVGAGPGEGDTST